MFSSYNSVIFSQPWQSAQASPTICKCETMQMLGYHHKLIVLRKNKMPGQAFTPLAEKKTGTISGHLCTCYCSGRGKHHRDYKIIAWASREKSRDKLNKSNGGSGI